MYFIMVLGKIYFAQLSHLFSLSLFRSSPHCSALIHRISSCHSIFIQLALDSVPQSTFFTNFSRSAPAFSSISSSKATFGEIQLVRASSQIYTLHKVRRTLRTSARLRETNILRDVLLRVCGHPALHEFFWFLPQPSTESPRTKYSVGGEIS